MAEPKDDTGPIIDPPTNHNEPTYPEMLAYSMADDLNALGALAGEMTEAVNALRPEKGKPPQIKSDEDVLTLAPLAKRARVLFNKLEKDRKEAKAPHLEKGGQVDDAYRAPKARATRIFEAAEGLATTYQNAVAARKRSEAAEKARVAAAEADKAREHAAAAKRPDTVEKREAIADEAEQKANIAAVEAQNASSAASIKGDGGKVAVSARGSWGATVTDFDGIDWKKLAPFIDRKAVDDAANRYAKLHKENAKISGIVFEKSSKASFR